MTADILAAGSVTAEKISVTDLSALNATIGGFTIGNKYLANGTTTLGTTEKSVYVGLDGISCGKNFIAKADGTVRIQGDVYCQNNIYMYSGYNQQYFSVLQYVVDSGDVNELYLHAPNGETIMHWSQEGVSGFSIENISCSKLTATNISTTKNITASGTVTAGSSLITKSIELSFSTPFIDFHYNKSSADFTSRLIDYGGNFSIYTNSGIFQFCNSKGTQTARIQSNGTFGAATGGTAIVGSAIYCQTTWSGGAYTAVYGASFTNPSSRLVKENVVDMSEEEAKKILQLKPVDFDYIEAYGGEKNQHGLIAEDTLDIIPSCVTIPEGYSEKEFDAEKGIRNKVLAIDYSKLVPYLIKMVQIQQEEIEKLKEAMNKEGVSND